MKKTALALMLAAAFAPSLAFAAAGDWVVRLRAAHINADEDSKLGRMTNAALGVTVLDPGAELEVDSNTIAELDISYYLTNNIALELILAIGSRHDVNIHKNPTGPLAGKHDLGEVNALPPTLTVQWHFNPDGRFDPYVGAGINYTRFLDNSLRLRATGFPIRVERDSWGPALQAGLDVNLKDGWLINADVKKIWIDTDVRMNPGTGYVKIDELDIDPWVFAIGIGKKF